MEAVQQMAIDKIAAALAKFQGEVSNPPKTKSGRCKGGTYMYADLAEILDHIRKPMASNGLSVIQLIQEGKLITRLIHSSGQFMESVYALPTAAIDAQSMGAAITYARRYSICAILGIAGEDDEDGQKAADAERDAAEAEADQKRENARQALEKLKEKGQVESAYTGKKVKPGEEIDPLAGIDKQLADLMRKDQVTPEQLEEYSKKAGHFPDGKHPKDFPVGYAEKMVQNWSKVIAKLKG